METRLEFLNKADLLLIVRILNALAFERMEPLLPYHSFGMVGFEAESELDPASRLDIDTAPGQVELESIQDERGNQDQGQNNELSGNISLHGNLFIDADQQKATLENTASADLMDINPNTVVALPGNTDSVQVEDAGDDMDVESVDSLGLVIGLPQLRALVSIIEVPRRRT